MMSMHIPRVLASLPLKIARVCVLKEEGTRVHLGTVEGMFRMSIPHAMQPSCGAHLAYASGTPCQALSFGIKHLPYPENVDESLVNVCPLSGSSACEF